MAHVLVAGVPCQASEHVQMWRLPLAGVILHEVLGALPNGSQLRPCPSHLPVPAIGGSSSLGAHACLQVPELLSASVRIEMPSCCRPSSLATWGVSRSTAQL